MQDPIGIGILVVLRDETKERAVDDSSNARIGVDAMNECNDAVRVMNGKIWGAMIANDRASMDGGLHFTLPFFMTPTQE